MFLNYTGFPFVASPKAKILILGSMPGERSIKERQYYAHPQNAFWDIMGNLFGARRDLQYQEKLKILRQHHVALWDVAFQCKRQGSLDSNIQTATVVPNNFKKLFARCRFIEQIFFNGRKAEQLFHELVLRDMGSTMKKLRMHRLPSTSPAHASLTKKEKEKIWKRNLRNSGTQYSIPRSR